MISNNYENATDVSICDNTLTLAVHEHLFKKKAVKT